MQGVMQVDIWLVPLDCLCESPFLVLVHLEDKHSRRQLAVGHIAYRIKGVMLEVGIEQCKQEGQIEEGGVQALGDRHIL